jgi:hypothetical protein
MCNLWLTKGKLKRFRAGKRRDRNSHENSQARKGQSADGSTREGGDILGHRGMMVSSCMYDRSIKLRFASATWRQPAGSTNACSACLVRGTARQIGRCISAPQISQQGALTAPAIAADTVPGSGNFCVLSDVPIAEIVAHLGWEGWRSRPAPVKGWARRGRSCRFISKIPTAMWSK